jgi:hypothetical protein
MRTAKELAKIFSNMSPDEKVWCIWVDRDELISIINDSEMSDENDNLITVDKDVITEDFHDEVMSSVDNAEYVWDRFNEELNDTTRDKFNDLLEEQKKLAEEELIDKDLWDTEGDESATSKDD